MKNLKKVLALVLAVVMIMSVVTVASAKTYTDVKATDDYATAIDILSNLNILDGFKDGDNYSFKADGTFTRAQAAKIVAIVHNAATNGKIKGQDAISGLYSNAQNPFVDCNSSWALPYINYCRITGLADGMTTTTYEPNRYVTGVQFLKLMLTTLNFDTAKEGYTGTGWDVNVLNRANEVGLTDGLADGWKAIAPVTRGEAAQILFNALDKYLVEYGQLVKGFNHDETHYNLAFVSNEQVAKSGTKLGEKMGITIADGYDAFWRPITTWTYNKAVVGTFLKGKVAEFTTLTSYCDVLKAIGVSEASKKTVKIESVFVNGWNNTAELRPEGQESYGHQKDLDCQSEKVGGQGVLTQVFKVGTDTYRITEIAVFLGHVQSAKKVTHPVATLATFDHIWGRNGSHTGNHFTADNRTDLQGLTLTTETTDFVAGDYALVYVSYKNVDHQGATGVEKRQSQYPADAWIVDADKTTGKVGTLNGAIGEVRSTPSQTRVDGTYVNDAWAFVEDYAAAHTIANNGGKYTFFYDTYGNVIGMLANSEAKNYVVADNIYKTYETGTYTANAKLVDFAKAESDAVLKYVTNLSAANANYNAPRKGNAVVKVGPTALGGVVDFSLDSAKTPNTEYTGLIYSYNDGTLVREGQNTLPRGSYAHAKNGAEIIGADLNGGVSNWKYKIDDDTKFLVKKAGTGEYEIYTGCTALPALTATVMDYVTVDGTDNTYCTMVYLGNAIYDGDSVTGYVPTFKAHDWADGYERITVYVAGEATTVLVKATNIGEDPITMGLAELQNDNVAGVYTFTNAVAKDGTVYATSITAKDAALTTAGTLFTSTVKKFGNNTITLNANGVATNEVTISLKDVKIYDARNGALKVIDFETLETAFNDAQGLTPAQTLTVKVYSTGSDKIDGLYIVG